VRSYRSRVSRVSQSQGVLSFIFEPECRTKRGGMICPKECNGSRNAGSPLRRIDVCTTQHSICITRQVECNVLWSCLPAKRCLPWVRTEWLVGVFVWSVFASRLRSLQIRCAASTNHVVARTERRAGPWYARVSPEGKPADGPSRLKLTIAVKAL
jgi:hypothetical protein